MPEQDEPLEWIERTEIVRGIELPWKRIEMYGPFKMHDGRMTKNPPKGTVLDSGTVFISSDTLWNVAERTSDDYLSAIPAPPLGYHQGLALEQAGLAERETRGGHHGTSKLREFIGYDGID